MLIYLLVVLLILLMQDKLQGLPAGALRERKEDSFLRVVCWILVLLTALRGSSVGADTIGYIADYSNMSFLSFAEVLEKKEDFPGFFLLAKICSFLHFPIQILFGIVGGLYIYSIYMLTIKFSEDKLYTILGFELIGLYAFSLAGLKQTLSMSFVLFYYMDIIDKKYFRAILFAIVAYYCHHVSLIFLFGILLYYIRNWKIYYWALTGIVVLSLLGTRFLWSNMLILLDKDHYSELYLEDEGYSSTTMIYYGVLLFFLILYNREYSKKEKEESRIFIGMSTLAFAFQAFSFVSSAAFRLSYYFLPFMIIGLPNCFNCIRDIGDRKMIKVLIASMIIFFFVYSNRNGSSVVPYKFFWQE